MTGRENSEAITAVIEKLTEIVGSNESTQDGFERHTDASEMEESCDSKKDGEVENRVDAGQALKPASAVLTNLQNLLPMDCKPEGVSTLSLSCGGSSQKGKIISSEQMVLNFPIKLANLNIASPQGLLETLQKLNAKLKVGMKEVDVVPPQPEEKHVKEEETEDCEARMLFKCSKCNYSSHNKHYLKQHTGLVHNAERLYKCPFCDYAGKRSYSLKEHLIVHSTYRPYECSYCNASFRKKGHLTNHVKMHSSQKTLACMLCHVSVQSRTQLYEHLRQDHDDDSVYACVVCEYATAIKSNIVMHMHTHGDPTVYKCRGCQFTAPHVNIIQQHLKAIHRDNGTVYSIEHAPDKAGTVILMKCSECGYTCTNKDVLKDHILQQHIDVSNLMEGLHEVDGDIVGKQTNRYKCVQCNYTNSEAYPFITHILSHKPKVPLTQALQEEGDQTKASSADETANAAATASGTVAVPSQRFTHDASNGMYRCAICNYTCEFQRTIKAHIWKHSGHKDIDYPMFQNGPLSVYDDTPVGMSILLSSKAPVSHVASSAVTDKNTIMTARPISIAPKKCLVTKTNAECSGKVPTPQPEDSPSGDKYKADPSIQKAIGRISSKGPVMVILSAAEKKKQQQLQENPAITSTDMSMKEKVKLSTPGVSNNSVSCPGGDHPTKPVSHKVVQAALVKTTQRPPVTMATTVHIVQSPASRTPPAPNHQAPTLVKQTQKPAAGDIKREEAVTTLLASSTEVLTKSGCKRKPGQDDSISDGENLRVIKKRPAEGSCLVLPPEMSSKTKCGGKSDVAVRNMPKFDLTKVLASSDVHEDVKPVLETIRGVEGNIDKTGQEIDDCEQQNSDKENMAEPKNTENTKEKTSSTDAAPLGTNSVLDVACCSTNMSCDNCGETPENEDGSKPNAGICQSLLAVIEQLRSRSESEGDDIGVDGSTSGAKRKCKLSGEWLADGNEHVEICDGQYRCRLCHYKSASATVVGVHMRLHKEKQPSECSLCDFQSDTSESLQEHMLQHCKLRTYQCRLCDCIFNYKSQLRAHMRAHIGTQLDVCRQCGFAAVDAAALNSHMDTHVKSGEVRQSVKTEVEHQKTDQLHSGGDKDSKTDAEQGGKSETYRMVPHKCDACGFTTTSQAYLAEHQHRQHGVDEKELECELCEFVATSVRSLKSHMKRHVNDQRFVLQPLEQYKCNLCGYVCHHLPSLKSHMWRHASDSNYSYESTNNIINAAIDFDMQRCIKRPPKEYRCNMCGYVCYHLPSLKSHMWRHSSDQNYHYKFMTDDFLNSFAVSQLAHDGKNAGELVLPLVTFRCCQCGFESTDKARLSDHMVVHADDGQAVPAQESANVSDGDVEMVTVEECMEEVTVTTCVQ